MSLAALIEQYKIIEHMTKCKLYVQIDGNIYSAVNIYQLIFYDNIR